jgi:hypothetical protein
MVAIVASPPTVACFSFTSVSRHWGRDRYEQWHQLDHLPENLALPHVVSGQRWERTAQCRSASRAASGELAGIDYVTMYLMRGSKRAAVEEWRQLSSRLRDDGRRPDSGHVTRPLVGAFAPVRGYVTERAGVSLAALTFRPTRGLFIRLSAVRGDPRCREHFASWRDREWIPAALDCRGVAGAWIFSGKDLWSTGASLSAIADATPEALQLQVWFLDGSPLVVADELRSCEARLEPRRDFPVETESVLLDGPLESVRPWSWTKA